MATKPGQMSPFDFQDSSTFPNPVNQNRGSGFWNTYDDQGSLGGVPASGLGQGGYVSNVFGGVGPLNTQQAADFQNQQSFGPWSNRSNDLFNTLVQRSQQSLSDINPHDPIIRNQTDAFQANAERSRRNYLNEVAEQAGPIANTSAERRSSAEKVAQNTASFQATLMGQELTARRTEIAQALFMMGSLLTDEQRMFLQRQLAQLDNALGRDTLAEKSREFDTNNQNSLLGL